MYKRLSGIVPSHCCQHCFLLGVDLVLVDVEELGQQRLDRAPNRHVVVVTGAVLLHQHDALPRQEQVQELADRLRLVADRAQLVVLGVLARKLVGGCRIHDGTRHYFDGLQDAVALRASTGRIIAALAVRLIRLRERRFALRADVDRVTLVHVVSPGTYSPLSVTTCASLAAASSAAPDESSATSQRSSAAAAARRRRSFASSRSMMRARRCLLSAITLS